MTGDLAATAWAVRRVRVDRRPPRELPTGVFVVTDSDHEACVVRLTPEREGRWRCSVCGIRCDTTDCLHIFAVAIHLAETELGLSATREVRT